MPQLYVLYEHATGFAIFRTSEFEEIAIFLPQVKRSITDISKFRTIVSLVAFQPFQNQKEALLNMQNICENKLGTDLQLFLENNIPKTKKSKQAVVLGVIEKNLASEITEKLGISCNTSGIVKEIIRGVRFHFNKLIKGFKDGESIKKAQQALAHNFSRKKVNFDATRQDSMIIQSHAMIDELEKDINTLGRRIKEWYSFHFPELFNLVDSNVELFIKCLKEIGDRKNLSEDIEEKLIALVGDSTKVNAILQAAHTSMGMEIAEVDLENMKMFCDRALSLIKKRNDSVDYLKAKMNVTAPSISTLVGEMLGSRLISRAGGLTSLAKLPASTVQVLGADKKLFRAVKGKEKANTCGFISKSAFMGKAGKTKKGHLARILANKCSLAARVDCFSKQPKAAFGSKLIQDVEQIVKLHKLFRKDYLGNTNKVSNGQPENNLNGKSLNKRNKIKKKNNSNSSMNNDIPDLNNTTSIATDLSPAVESDTSLLSDSVKQKGKEDITKEVFKTDENEESVCENVPEAMEIESLPMKKTSLVMLSETENAYKEASDLEENVLKPKTVARKSTRKSVKRKSVKN